MPIFLSLFISKRKCMYHCKSFWVAYLVTLYCHLLGHLLGVHVPLQKLTSGRSWAYHHASGAPTSLSTMYYCGVQCQVYESCRNVHVMEKNVWAQCISAEDHSILTTITRYQALMKLLSAISICSYIEVVLSPSKMIAIPKQQLASYYLLSWIPNSTYISEKFLHAEWVPRLWYSPGTQKLLNI